ARPRRGVVEPAVALAPGWWRPSRGGPIGTAELGAGEHRPGTPERRPDLRLPAGRLAQLRRRPGGRRPGARRDAGHAGTGAGEPRVPAPGRAVPDRGGDPAVPRHRVRDPDPGQRAPGGAAVGT